MAEKLGRISSAHINYFFILFKLVCIILPFGSVFYKLKAKIKKD